MTDEASLNAKKVADLKTELTDLGLATTGKKAELVERLLEHYQGQGSTPAENNPKEYLEEPAEEPEAKEASPEPASTKRKAASPEEAPAPKAVKAADQGGAGAAAAAAAKAAAMAAAMTEAHNRAAKVEGFVRPLREEQVRICPVGRITRRTCGVRTPPRRLAPIRFTIPTT